MSYGIYPTLCTDTLGARPLWNSFDPHLPFAKVWSFHSEIGGVGWGGAERGNWNIVNTVAYTDLKMTKRETFIVYTGETKITKLLVN